MEQASTQTFALFLDSIHTLLQIYTEERAVTVPIRDIIWLLDYYGLLNNEALRDKAYS